MSTKSTVFLTLSPGRSSPGKIFMKMLRRFALLVICVGTAMGLGTATPQAQTRAYVANFGSNTVSVVDTATDTVVATIPVGDPIGVAITPDGTRAYVTDLSRGSDIEPRVPVLIPRSAAKVFLDKLLSPRQSVASAHGLGA